MGMVGRKIRGFFFSVLILLWPAIGLAAEPVDWKALAEQIARPRSTSRGSLIKIQIAFAGRDTRLSQTKEYQSRFFVIDYLERLAKITNSDVASLDLIASALHKPEGYFDEDVANLELAMVKRWLEDNNPTDATRFLTRLETCAQGRPKSSPEQLQYAMAAKAMGLYYYYFSDAGAMEKALQHLSTAAALLLDTFDVDVDTIHRRLIGKSDVVEPEHIRSLIETAYLVSENEVANVIRVAQAKLKAKAEAGEPATEDLADLLVKLDEWGVRPLKNRPVNSNYPGLDKAIQKRIGRKSLAPPPNVAPVKPSLLASCLNFFKPFGRRK